MKTESTFKGPEAAAVVAALKQAYPEARCSLRFANPLETLVAVLLSSQCRDERVNAVTEKLFRTYRTAADYARAETAELEEELRPLGLYKNKARNLRALGRKLVEGHRGAVPRTVAALTELPGVGRKTALVVLQEAFGIETGIAVDTHVARLSRRLGLTEESTPEKIERDLQKVVPAGDWARINHLLIAHGRAVCTAQRPRCSGCCLREYCRTGRESGGE